MDLSIVDTLIAIMILAILPLVLLGLLANTAGTDSREWQETTRSMAPWSR